MLLSLVILGALTVGAIAWLVSYPTRLERRARDDYKAERARAGVVSFRRCADCGHDLYAGEYLRRAAGDFVCIDHPACLFRQAERNGAA